MPENHTYAVNLRWTGAAAGPTVNYKSYSRDWEADLPGKPTVVGTADPHFRGDPARQNPEELLVVALSSCHLLTYLAVCAQAGVEVLSYTDEAGGTLGFVEGGYRMTDVLLRPRVVVSRAADVEKATALHEKAHAGCFIARSVNFPVRHEALVTAADPA